MHKRLSVPLTTLSVGVLFGCGSGTDANTWTTSPLENAGGAGVPGVHLIRPSVPGGTMCTATLVAPKKLLTAAHCVAEPRDRNSALRYASADYQPRKKLLVSSKTGAGSDGQGFSIDDTANFVEAEIARVDIAPAWRGDEYDAAACSRQQGPDPLSCWQYRTPDIAVVTLTEALPFPTQWVSTGPLPNNPPDGDGIPAQMVGGGWTTVANGYLDKYAIRYGDTAIASQKFFDIISGFGPDWAPYAAQQRALDGTGYYVSILQNPFSPRDGSKSYSTFRPGDSGGPLLVGGLVVAVNSQGNLRDPTELYYFASSSTLRSVQPWIENVICPSDEHLRFSEIGCKCQEGYALNGSMCVRNPSQQCSFGAQSADSSRCCSDPGPEPDAWFPPSSCWDYGLVEVDGCSTWQLISSSC